jgi:hypothetical protein
MISIASRHMWLLSLAAGFALLSAAALAQAPPTAATDDADEAEEETAAPSVKKDEDPLNKEDLLKDVDIDKLDWSQLNVDASTLNMPSVNVGPAHFSCVKIELCSCTKLGWLGCLSGNA